MEKLSRRSFLLKAGLATAGLAAASSYALSASAQSYRRIAGANNRINTGIAGIRSRGLALIKAVQSMDNASIAMLCDVDANVLRERTDGLKSAFPGIEAVKDFRKMVESKNIDAVVIASPDHTHTPFAIYALQNGKHVYVEKPVSHNPREGELLISAQKKYNKLVQVGNQQRSSATSQQAIKDIQAGAIGEVYNAFCWYSANRGTIGNGKTVPVPEWLDWELWQGPAPRKAYTDNVVHYNWHWFTHWGTGEICNNGLHELDICRWAMGAGHPYRVVSSGGRFAYQDDWQFFDTQDVTFFYDKGKTIQWKGYSCNNNVQFQSEGRGTQIYGSKGSIFLDRNVYKRFDLGGKPVSEMKEEQQSGTVDLVGEGPLVINHMKNFMDGIRTGQKLNSPVEEVNKTNLLCHYGNIAQFEGGILEVNPENGSCSKKITRKYWSRDYQEGWDITKV